MTLESGMVDGVEGLQSRAASHAHSLQHRDILKEAGSESPHGGAKRQIQGLEPGKVELGSGEAIQIGALGQIQRLEHW